MTITKNNSTFVMAVLVWFSIILSLYTNFPRSSITSLLQTAKIFFTPKIPKSVDFNPPKNPSALPHHLKSGVQLPSHPPPPGVVPSQHRIMWRNAWRPEINQRINYPCTTCSCCSCRRKKYSTLRMLSRSSEFLGWQCTLVITLFSSMLTLGIFIAFLDMRYVPLEKTVQSNRAVKLLEELVPTPEEVWECMRRGVVISHTMRIFGIDPLALRPD